MTTINDLTHDQKVALVGLVEAIVLADGLVSETECAGIGKLAEELGDNAYRALLDEVDNRFEDVDALKSFLETIDDQDARELIYGTAWEESMACPDTHHTETELLEWLKNTWDIAMV